MLFRTGSIGIFANLRCLRLARREPEFDGVAVRFEAPRETDWIATAPEGVRLERVYFGHDSAFQVATGVAQSEPGAVLMRALRDLRQGRKLMSVAVAVSHGERATLLVPGEHQPVTIPAAAAQRALQAALGEASEIEAVDRLRDSLHAQAGDAVSGEREALFGCQNRGLFARHYLEHRVPKRADWQASGEKGQRLRAQRGVQLIDALGFHRSQGPNGTQLLSTAGAGGAGAVVNVGSKVTRAVAVLLDRGESWDAPSARFELSPVAFGLREAAEREAPWLVVVSGDRVRLYSGKPGVGVGHQGQVDTYFEIDLTLAGDDQIGLLPLIFSAEALTVGGSAQQLLEGSANYSTELGTRLRERIYEQVVPELAKCVARQLPALGIPLDEAGLQRAYGASLRILFRLLFQAYSEDRELLPAGRNDRYDANSLKSFVKREKFTDPHAFGPAYTVWSDLTQVWDVIDQGDTRWQVPAYSGGLFSKDAMQNPDGALIERLRVPDSVLGPALQALMLDTDADGIFGPVDFSSMSVREFGTIYEGLLESSLSVAEVDMTVDAKGAWVPVRGDGASGGLQGGADPVLASAGEVYFHSASGERKATGSYFTPKIIVDHLVERSVRPAVERHLAMVAALLDAGQAAKAGEKFFDVRVADLAMGSGHFLVAAIDEIEARMRDFLTRRPILGVQDELNRLAAKANEALGDDEVAKGEVEDVGLLRRQVARRCVYGLDINPLSVELARLAIWIHTFVPGLPLSSLDHTLVCANSLTGIGTVDEALNVLIPKRRPDERTLLDGFIEEPLERAAELLKDAAAAGEADRSEIAAAAELFERAQLAARPVKLLFDAAVALRTGAITPEVLMTPESIDEFVNRPVIAETAEQLKPAHMPVLFPEVFLRENPGFDALVGNPPWEKVKIETHQWWGLRLPGLRSLPQKQKNEMLAEFRANRPDLEAAFVRDVEATDAFRKVLLQGPFTGLGKGGDPDLYQAFAWRNWQLTRDRGRAALVVPRGALSGSALRSWREQVLREGAFADVLFATNTKQWLFECVHPQYTVGLTVVERDDTHVARFAGPIFSAGELAGAADSLAEIPAEEFLAMSATAAFPLLPDAEAGEIFRIMRRSPGFGVAQTEFEYRPIAELHATGDKALLEFDTDAAHGRIPVYAGASFNLWDPDFGKPYAYARPEVLRPHLSEKLGRAARQTRSVYAGMRFEDGELPLDHPRIAFRDVTNRTNRRTAIVALIPPGTSAIHKAPVLVRRRGGALAEAHLLGVMSSIPFDWYMRRWVELTMSFELLNVAPTPVCDPAHPHVRRIVEISGRLAAVDERYAEWAAEVGVPVGSVKSAEEKDDLLAELDALVALRYGLSTEQVEHIFRTFHRGWDPSERLARVLEHFRGWESRA